MDSVEIVWTDYMKYRATLRGFDIPALEHIVRHSSERYIDAATRRRIAVGRHEDQIVMIPCDVAGNVVTPVTVHVTSRQQINARVRSGRLQNE